MAGSSVVSASSIVFDAKGAILNVFNRFYLPAERINPYAAAVHGLTLDRLTALRKHIRSTPYFIEDWPDLLDFWEDCGVDGVVVHNLLFDAAFLPEIAQNAMRWWCSMRGLTAFCAIPKRSSPHAQGPFKWPRLGEAADIICNGPNALQPPDATALIEEAVGAGSSHVSLFDCFELYRMVSRIGLHHKNLIEFKPLLTKFRPPPSPGSEARAAKKAASPMIFEDPFISEILSYERKVRSMI